MTTPDGPHSERSWKVGDAPWVASIGSTASVVPCPVCGGMTTVRVIGAIAADVACEFCSRGGMGPTGVVEHEEWSARSEQRRITAVRSEQTARGEEVEYVASHYLLKPENMFVTEAEANVRAAVLAKEHQQAVEGSAFNRAKHARSKATWCAGYYRRQIQDLERQLAYAKARYKEVSNDNK